MKPRVNAFEKRQKEFARKERQKQKAARRDVRERERAERPTHRARRRSRYRWDCPRSPAARRNSPNS